MNKIIDFLKNQFRDGFFWTKVDNPRDISDPIVEAIKEKEYETLNPNEVSTPIVEAQERTTQAIKEIEFPEFPEIPKIPDFPEFPEIPEADFSELSQKMEEVKEVLLKKKDKFETKPIIKILKKIADKIPTIEEKEVVDYTLLLSDVLTELEKDKYSENLDEIKNILEKISKVGLPKNKDGRIKVEVDRIGIMPSTIGIEASNGDRLNPSTEEKQDTANTLLQQIINNTDELEINTENIELNTDELEAKLDEIITINKDDYAVNVQLDSGDGRITYVGSALIGTLTSEAKWQIQKIDETTGTVITWADGDSNYDNVFDNRESLTYS